MNNTTSPTAKAERRTRQPFGLATDFRINNLNRGATQGRPMKAIALAIVAVPAAIAGVWAWRKNKNLPPIVKTIVSTVVFIVRMVVNPIQEKVVAEVAEVLEDLPPVSTDPALAAKLMKLVETGQPVLLIAKGGKKNQRSYRGRLTVHMTAGDIYMFSVKDKGQSQPVPLFALADVVRIVKIPGLMVTGLEVTTE